jgi:hypothetical protein
MTEYMTTRQIMKRSYWLSGQGFSTGSFSTMKKPATMFKNKVVPTVTTAIFIHSELLLTIILPPFLKIFIEDASLIDIPGFAVVTETTDFSD